MNKIKISSHFSLDEFQCPCCGLVKLSEILLVKLEFLRQTIEAPIIITSGYRCPKRNEIAGGTEQSQHLLGKAVDCYSPRMQISEFLKKAEEVFHDGGVGTYKGKHFCHLDTGKKRRWCK